MHRIAAFPFVASVFLVSACGDQGTEPSSRHAPSPPMFAHVAGATVVNLDHVSVATGTDQGPQDGIFDEFTGPNLGSVNNNGFTSFRTAFEFSLASVPAGASINTADLRVVLSNFEGTRALLVHGYAGDGTVQLTDFALDGLVGTASASPTGTQTFVFDVTELIADLVASAESFVGIGVREEPANTSNFVVMFLDLTGAPVLSIEFTPTRIVEIDVRPGSFPNPVNLRSQGKVPVAILSDPTFDAPTDVNVTSLTFGRTGDEASFASCSDIAEDVNGDGLPDLVCQFGTQLSGFLASDTEAVLKGETLDAVSIQGVDSVEIVP